MCNLDYDYDLPLPDDVGFVCGGSQPHRGALSGAGLGMPTVHD